MDILSKGYNFSEPCPKQLVSKEEVNKELARAARFTTIPGEDTTGHINAFQKQVLELILPRIGAELTSYTQQQAAIVANKMASNRHLPENWTAKNFSNITTLTPIGSNLESVNDSMTEISKIRLEKEREKTAYFRQQSFAAYVRQQSSEPMPLEMEKPGISDKESIRRQKEAQASISKGEGRTKEPSIDALEEEEFGFHSEPWSPKPGEPGYAQEMRRRQLQKEQEQDQHMFQAHAQKFLGRDEYVQQERDKIQKFFESEGRPEQPSVVIHTQPSQEEQEAARERE